MALSENEEEGISLEGATGVSACIGTPIVVWYEVEHCM
jgi:hypothetical protein